VKYYRKNRVHIKPVMAARFDTNHSHCNVITRVNMMNWPNSLFRELACVVLDILYNIRYSLSEVPTCKTDWFCVCPLLCCRYFLGKCVSKYGTLISECFIFIKKVCDDKNKT